MKPEALIKALDEFHTVWMKSVFVTNRKLGTKALVQAWDKVIEEVDKYNHLSPPSEGPCEHDKEEYWEKRLKRGWERAFKTVAEKCPYCPKEPTECKHVLGDDYTNYKGNYASRWNGFYELQPCPFCPKEPKKPEGKEDGKMTTCNRCGSYTRVCSTCDLMPLRLKLEAMQAVVDAARKCKFMDAQGWADLQNAILAYDAVQDGGKG